MWKLWIDDIREPPKDFVWKQTVEEAQTHIITFGFPLFISFDHDLGENKLTGYDLAKWMIEEDLDKNIIPHDFTFHVHSMNPIGRENIKQLLERYLRFKIMEQL